MNYLDELCRASLIEIDNFDEGIYTDDAKRKFIKYFGWYQGYGDDWLYPGADANHGGYPLGAAFHLCWQVLLYREHKLSYDQEFHQKFLTDPINYKIR